MPNHACPFNPNSGDYLAFLGRISPEKRPDRAIEIAKRAGVKLKIAAKLDRVNREYFETKIKPLLDHPLIEFIGEMESQKCNFVGGAMALLFPVDWEEPFGLVMIEAMSAGTPVIAWRKGSVPEVMKDGAGGFIVDTIDEAVEAVGRIFSLGRTSVRNYFESRFTVAHMAKNYVAAYDALAASSRRDKKTSIHLVGNNVAISEDRSRIGVRNGLLHALPALKVTRVDNVADLSGISN